MTDNNLLNIDFSSLDTSISDIIVPFNKQHNCNGLNVLNLSYYENDLTSELFAAMGAEVVFSVSPSLCNLENKPKIKKYSVRFEDFEIPADIKFDIVFGLDLLNNIIDLDKLVNNLKNITKEDTAFYLNGFMPFTSPFGHLIYTDHHKYFNETNPLKFWQHLSFSNDDEFKIALAENGVNESDINNIIDSYSLSKPFCRYSPSEIINKLQNVKALYPQRIMKYLTKNEFYEQAKQKYLEVDLNTERIILKSDFPVSQWFDKLDINDYIRENISDLNSKYNFSGKKILNLAPYINFSVTDGVEAMGVKEVISFAPYYSSYELKCGNNVRCVNHHFEDLDNLDEKFDIIYGLDVLEHVNDLKRFYSNLIRLIDDKGIICLQGSPIWPSDDGYNYKDILECGRLNMGYGEKCLAPWEHLAYDTKEELKQSMLKKSFSEHDSEVVSDFVFNSTTINRRSFTEYLNSLNEFDNITYGVKKVLHFSPENEFYEKASEKYTHEELRTKILKLFIRKKHNIDS